MKTILISLAALFVTLSTPAQAALLLGKTVQLSYDFPAQGTVSEGPFDNLVGTTGGTVFLGGKIIATPSDTQLSIHSDCMSLRTCLFAGFPFNGIHLRDGLGTISAFTSVTVNGLTDLPGFDNSRISFDADNIFLNFAGLSGDPHDVVVDIRTASSVPEPATWAMMIVGLGLAGAALRKANRQQKSPRCQIAGSRGVRRHMHVARKALLTSLMSMLTVGAAHATVAVSISETTGVPVDTVTYTMGWSFTVNQSITVDSLGVFDDGGDGLRDVVEVGLWDGSGASGFALLALTTVPLGTGGTLINQFRYASIAPVTLTAGKSYLIGALYHALSDGIVFYPSNVVSDPAISFYRGTYFPGVGVIQPPVFIDGGDNIGPNFTFNSAVPEPATWAMMIVGFGLVGGALRKANGGRRDLGLTRP